MAAGATDRLLPIAGWTLPGCYSLGGSQIALKAQACSIGAPPIFLGSGPLLTLVAYQYLKAGVRPAAVLDTAPHAALYAALPVMLARPGLMARGAMMRARIPFLRGVVPVAIKGR